MHSADGIVVSDTWCCYIKQLVDKFEKSNGNFLFTTIDIIDTLRDYVTTHTRE